MSARRLAADLRYAARHRWARAGLWACAAMAAAVLAAFALWWPAQREQAALEQEVAAKRRGLAQAQQSEELLRAYRQASGEVALLEAKLQHAATQAQLVQELARLAHKRYVRIVSETYEDSRGAGAQPALSAELSVQGGYPALRDFVNDLSTLRTWSEVQEVRFENVQGAATQKGRIRIVTYRQAGKAAMGVVP